MWCQWKPQAAGRSQALQKDLLEEAVQGMDGVDIHLVHQIPAGAETPQALLHHIHDAGRLVAHPLPGGVAAAHDGRCLQNVPAQLAGAGHHQRRGEDRRRPARYGRRRTCAAPRGGSRDGATLVRATGLRPSRSSSQSASRPRYSSLKRMKALDAVGPRAAQLHAAKGGPVEPLFGEIRVDALEAEPPGGAGRAG